MAAIGKPEDAKSDDKEAGADLDLALPFDEGEQQREGEEHEQHRQQVAGGQWPKRAHQCARAPFHQSGRNS
jgi:hypothetical protein